MTAQLTAKETALMSAIAERHFSFFDEGLTVGSGIWVNTATDEVAGNAQYPVSATSRGVASVINSVSRKGLLEQSTNEEEGAWIALTEEGVAWCEEHNANPEANRAAAATAAEAEPAEAAPELAKGDKVRTEDGKEWTVRRIITGGVEARLIDAEGKKVNRKLGALTKIA